MLYEFKGCDNPLCPDKHAPGDQLVYIMNIRGRCPAIGSKRKCPVSGCRGRVTRVVSVPHLQVRGGPPPLAGGDMMHARVGGNDIAMQFVDHKHTDPSLRRDLSRTPSRRGAKRGVVDAKGLGNCRFDEKMGRVVVDVVSNVKDPLGAMQRARKDMPMTTTAVNQSYRVRSRKKGR